MRCVDPLCNGRGACDIRNGICVCRQGFLGSSCEHIMCPYNCTGNNGVCDAITGVCTCSPDWEGAGCHINLNIKDLELINYISRFIGTTFVIVATVCIVVMGFTRYPVGTFGLNGHVMALIEFLQFLGLVGFIGKNLDPLFKKFSYSFSWANFTFNLGLISSATQMDRGPIFFLDNFFIVCIFVLLCGIFASALSVYRNYTGRSKDVVNCLMLVGTRILIIAYSGLSISVTYEIGLAFQGRITIIAFIGALCIFFGYVLVFPIGGYLFLKDGIPTEYANACAPLYTDFKENNSLFGVGILWKKFMFGILVGVFQSNPQDQMIALILILICYLGIVIIMRPYKDDLRTYVEALTIIIQIVNIILEMLMWILPRPISILLIVINTLTIFGLVLTLIYRIFTNVRPLVMKRKAIKEISSPNEEEQNSQDGLLTEEERINESQELNDIVHEEDTSDHRLLSNSQKEEFNSSDLVLEQ